MEKIHILLIILFIFSSCMVVISQNPVHSVLFLVITFGLASINVIMLDIEFLGLLFLIIYVGAIAILFLFVIMMLSVKTQTKFEFIVALRTIIASFLILALSYKSFNFFSSLIVPFNFSFNGDYINNLVTFGQVLYNYYLILFLIAGLILLVAVIGAVVLTLEHKNNIKTSVTFRQLSRSKDTVKFGK